MLKWVKKKRTSAVDNPGAARRLNALYDEQRAAAAGDHEGFGMGLKRADTAWDISLASGSPDYDDAASGCGGGSAGGGGGRDGGGGLNEECLERATSVSAASSDRSTEFSAGEMMDSWLEFPFESLIVGQILHEGNFTCIMKAEAESINGTEDPQAVCVKMLKDGVHRRYSKLLRSELELTKDIGHHPNIVTIVGSCMLRHPDPPCLVMEYLTGGNLLRYMRASRGATSADPDDDLVPQMTGDLLMNLICQIAKGMAYLESTDVVHRDLSARNVFLSHDLVPKIGNFDSCIESRLSLKYNRGEEPKFLQNRKKHVCEKWSALETLANGTFSSASDVWSFGVLAWEVITVGGAPYSGVRPDNMLLYIKAGKRMERPPHCSEQLYDIVRGCWQATPAWRPRFSQLVDTLELLSMQPQDHVDVETYDGNLYLKFDAEYKESQLL